MRVLDTKYILSHNSQIRYAIRRSRTSYSNIYIFLFIDISDLSISNFFFPCQIIFAFLFYIPSDKLLLLWLFRCKNVVYNGEKKMNVDCCVFHFIRNPCNHITHLHIESKINRKTNKFRILNEIEFYTILDKNNIFNKQHSNLCERIIERVQENICIAYHKSATRRNPHNSSNNKKINK